MTASDSENLKNIFKELDVGSNGFLNQEELSIVCQHIGMPKMTNKELSHLYNELDKDSDGKISLDEFVNGILQENSYKGHDINLPQTNTFTDEEYNNKFTIIPKDSAKKKLERSKQMRRSNLSSKLNWLKSLATNDNSDFVNAQILIDFWNKCSIQDNYSIFELLELDTNEKIDLRDLSHSLEQELRIIVNKEDNILSIVAVDSMCALIASLQSENEDLNVEKEQLRLESEASKKLAADVADDADEFIAKLEKSKNEEIKALMEQLTRKTSHNYISTSSHDVQHMADQLSILKRENNELREKIVNLDNLKTDKDLRKSLNDSKSESRQIKHLEAAMSLERRELKEQYMLEISEVEQKCQEQISLLEKEMQYLKTSQQRLLDEALAKKEAELLSEFVKESMKEVKRKEEELNQPQLNLSADSVLLDEINAQLKDKDIELRQVNLELNEARRKILLLEKEIENSDLNYKNQIQQLRHNFEELKKGMQPLAKDADLNNSKNKLMENITNLEKKIGQLSQKNEMLEEDNRKSKEKSLEFESKWKQVLNELINAQNHIKEINHSGRDILKNELEKCMQELLDSTTTLKILTQKYEQEKSAWTFEKNGLISSQTNLSESNDLLERKIEQLIKRNKELMELIEENRERNNQNLEDSSNLNNFETKLNEVNNKHELDVRTFQQKELNFNEEVTRLNRALNQSNSEKFDLNLQIQKLKIELEMKVVNLSHFEKNLNAIAEKEGKTKLIVDNLQKQLSDLNKEKSNLLLTEQHSKCEIELLKNLLNKQADEMNESKKVESNLRQKIFQLSSQEKEFARDTKKILDAESALEFVANQKEEEQQRINNGAVQLANMSTKLLKAEMDVRKLKNILELNQEENAFLQNLSLEEKTHEIKMLSKEQIDLKKIVDNLRTQNGELNDTIIQLATKVTNCEELIKELYQENVQLIKCLQIMEQSKNEIENKNISLDQKCSTLVKLVTNIYPATL